MEPFSALSAGRLDLRVDVQRSGDAKRVPGAVGEVGLVLRVNLEGSLNAGERIRHQDVMSAWVQEKGMALMKRLVSGGSLIVSQSEAPHGLIHMRRMSRLCKVLIDKGANIPERVFIHNECIIAVQ